MSSVIILEQMLVIAVIVGIGFFLGKNKIIGDDVSKSMSVMVLDICSPALGISSIISSDITVGHMQMIRALGISVIMYVFLCFFGLLLPKILLVPYDKQKFYNAMTVYTNIGFMGIPLSKAILSDEAVVYVVICNVIFCLFFYTHGVCLIGTGDEGFSLKKIISPGTVSALFTMCICWFEISVPDALSSLFSYLGGATVFLSMSMVGASLARADLLGGLKNLRLWSYVLVRMVAFPVIIGFILKFTGSDEKIISAFVLMCSMPVANLPMIQAQKAGIETDTLSNAIVVTTLISFVSVTVVMSILSGFIIK